MLELIDQPRLESESDILLQDPSVIINLYKEVFVQKKKLAVYVIY